MLKNMQRTGLVIYVLTSVQVLGLRNDAKSKISQSYGENFQIHDGPFVYFAYGSNLLKQRLKINIKSSQFITSATLAGWRLDFNRTAGSWNGAVATIAQHPGSTIWGSLWLIARQDLDKLDKQENWYDAVSVTVNATDLGPVAARTYVQPYPPPYVEPELLPAERQPSSTYFKAILYGAIESNLPVKYLQYLERFPNNGKSATTSKLMKLGYPFYDHSICV